MIGLLYLGASLFFTLNAAETLGLPFSNVFEKAAYLALAAALIFTRRVNAWSLIAMLLTIALVIGLGAMTSYPAFRWSTLFLSLNQFIIVYALIGFRPSEAEAHSILRTTAWMPVVSVVAGLIALIVSGRPVFLAEWATGIPRLQGSLIPAFLSGLGLSGVVASLLLGVEWRRLPYLWLTAVNFVILVMAGGRAALVACLLVFSASIFLNHRINPRDKGVFALGGILLAPIALAIAAPFVLNRLLESTDNGRNAMAAFLGTLIDRYPLTGIGFGHQYWATPPELESLVGSLAAHNDYLRITVELGYIGGAIFYILLLLAYLRAMTRGARFNYVALAGLIGFALLMASDNALATPPYFPILLIALLAGITGEGRPLAARDSASSDGSPPRNSPPTGIALTAADGSPL